MNADPTSIERIRSATFESARRGYKKQDVDRFLASLADWLESGEGRKQSTVVKEALEDVGRRTGAILITAEESAQEIRDKAQKEREEADTYAKQARERADQQATALKESSEAEAERIRSVAARDAEEATTKAKADVRAIVDRGDATKAEIEAEIEELGKRREAILGRIDELASQLSGAANEHRPTEQQAAAATASESAEPEPSESNGGGNGGGAAKPSRPKAAKASGGAKTAKKS